MPVLLPTADSESGRVQSASASREAWTEYERRKRQFIQVRSDASPDEYEAFIRALTEELGL